MRHFFLCKLSYLVCSPLVRLMLILRGINVFGSLFAGFPYINIAKGSTIKIGKKCRFMSNTIGNLIGVNHKCMLTTNNMGACLTIGNNCGFSGTSIWCFDSITIGNNVRVGANVVIMDGDAHQNDPRAGSNAPIIVEDNVWIGTGVMVLKGVTIGRNSLIGAGSVVVKDIPANTVAAGNPCKPIKELSPEVIKELEQQ